MCVEVGTSLFASANLREKTTHERGERRKGETPDQETGGRGRGVDQGHLPLIHSSLHPSIHIRHSLGNGVTSQDGMVCGLEQSGLGGRTPALQSRERERERPLHMWWHQHALHPFPFPSLPPDQIFLRVLPVSPPFCTFLLQGPSSPPLHLPSSRAGVHFRRPGPPRRAVERSHLKCD